MKKGVGGGSTEEKFFLKELLPTMRFEGGGKRFIKIMLANGANVIEFGSGLLTKLRIAEQLESFSLTSVEVLNPYSLTA